LGEDTDGSKTAAELLLEGEPVTSALKAELAEAAKQQADRSDKNATAKTLAQQTLSQDTDGSKTAAKLLLKGEPVTSALKAELAEAAKQQADSPDKDATPTRRASDLLGEDTDGSKTAAKLLLEGKPVTSVLKAELAEAAKQQADGSD